MMRTCSKVTSNPFIRRLAFLVCAALTVMGTHFVYRLWSEDASTASPADRSSKEIEPLQLPQPAASSDVIDAPASGASASGVSNYRNANLRSAISSMGSEGYAPIVRTALASGTPSDALRAFFILKNCNDIQKDMERLTRNRSVESNRIQSENQTRLIKENLAEQRACQTIDQETSSMRSALLLKSTIGGELGAASIYLTENSASTLDSDRQSAIRQLLIDANLGHQLSIMMAAIDGVKKYGLTADEQFAYQAATRIIISEHPDDIVASNTSLVKLLGMFFDSDKIAVDSKASALEERVRKLVDAHIKLKQQGKD